MSGCDVNQRADVFLLAGQSNMAGAAPGDNGSGHPEATFQWSGGELIPATRRLHHPWDKPGCIGLDIDFAREWRKRHPDRAIVFIPCAVGGTGFCDGKWTLNGRCYVETIGSVNQAMVSLGCSAISGILWHQGERDRFSPNDYSYSLRSLINGFRSEIESASKDTPFILGPLAPSLVNECVGASEAMDQIHDTAAFMDNTHLAGVELKSQLRCYDGLHFDAQSVRLLGRSYATALSTLLYSAA